MLNLPDACAGCGGIDALQPCPALWHRHPGGTRLNHELTLHLVQGLSGARVQYSRNSPEVDHIFPRSELRKQEKAEDDINDLANFWILAQGKNRNKSNRRPKDYFADVSDTQLRKALIDRSMLDYRQFKKFVRQRRGSMLEQLSKKVSLTDDDLQRS